jgi:hypothetical protein
MPIGALANAKGQLDLPSVLHGCFHSIHGGSGLRIGLGRAARTGGFPFHWLSGRLAPAVITTPIRHAIQSGNIKRHPYAPALSRPPPQPVRVRRERNYSAANHHDHCDARTSSHCDCASARPGDSAHASVFAAASHDHNAISCIDETIAEPTH